MNEYKMTDYDADELLTDISDLKSEKKRYEDIAIEKIDNIQFKVTLKTQKIDDEIQYKKDQLAAFFLTVDKKDSKTQQSYSLLSGKLIMKKATQKIAHDDVELLKWVKVYESQYTSNKLVYKLDWATLKKDLIITNGMIVNKVTNEVLEDVEGLSIEDVKESFDIK